MKVLRVSIGLWKQVGGPLSNFANSRAMGGLLFAYTHSKFGQLVVVLELRYGKGPYLSLYVVLALGHVIYVGCVSFEFEWVSLLRIDDRVSCSTVIIFFF